MNKLNSGVPLKFTFSSDGLQWKWRCHFDVASALVFGSGTSQCIIEPPHDKTNKVACAPSEDSEQPGHPPSLIRVFAVGIKKEWVLGCPLSAQRRLRSSGCPGWFESSLGAHATLLVLSWGGSVGGLKCFLAYCTAHSQENNRNEAK